jgi:pyruvate dehydrogenase E2 component (dihydrolipoamide acetyltransferase)
MAKPIIMPKFGMTQEEATIVRWLVQEGAWVEQGDPLCEVTTDKINMEVEAPADGFLAGIRFADGETVPVTEIIAYLLAKGEALTDSPPGLEPVPSRQDQVSPSAPPQAAEPQQAELAGDGKVKATPVARRMAAAEGIELDSIPGGGLEGWVTRHDVERYLSGRPLEKPGGAAGKVRASPAARRMARQHGIRLDAVAGTGPGGRVQGWDVEGAAAALVERSGAPVSTPVPREAPTPRPSAAQPLVIPLEGMRRTIAERMQASAQQAPHIMLSMDIDMGRAQAMREDFNARLAGQKTSISMTAVLVKACAAALKEHPLLNSYFMKDQILVMPQINVGVAVAIEEGLIVPVVRDADQKSLVQVGQEVNALSRRAREGVLQAQEVMDGTFTISNLGMFGVDHFTAIINPPQVAILAAGRVAKRFVPDEFDRPVLRALMTVTLSVDHRVVDGAGAARFLNTLRGILETAGAQWG